MIFYRLLISLLFPAVLLTRRLRGGDTAEDTAQRLGRAGPSPQDPRPQTLLWLHGASNGELTSAKPLIDALLAAHSDLHLVVTANTATGRALAAGWRHPRITARLAPVDLLWTTARFVKAWAPTGLIIVENEIWPNRLDLARRNKLPVAIVAARLSETSARRWRRYPALARRLLGAVWLISPQSEGDRNRLADLDLPPAVLAPPVMLKAAVTLPPPDPGTLHTLRASFARGSTLLAASTHPGEEAQILAAFAEARKRRPGLRLILAPRHVARGDEVAQLLTAARLDHARRSTGALPGPRDAVYLADTLGEMSLWYTLAGACFVGGSLVDKRGHTPFEPAAFGCAILHGPDTRNFADAYAALAAADAALAVEDATALGQTVARLTPARMTKLGEAARLALGTDTAKAGIADLTARLGRIFGLNPVP